MSQTNAERLRRQSEDRARRRAKALLDAAERHPRRSGAQDRMARAARAVEAIGGMPEPTYADRLRQRTEAMLREAE